VSFYIPEFLRLQEQSTVASTLCFGDRSFRWLPSLRQSPPWIPARREQSTSDSLFANHRFFITVTELSKIGITIKL
jgi:hypothetical protein